MKRNMVYRLTNISKSEGRRYYIGSKQEATLEQHNGVMSILDRNDKPYYSSTTCDIMLSDVRNGDVLVAEVLEYVPLRENLCERENYHIIDNDAVNSDEYYNRNYAILNAHYDQNALANAYGETVKQYASRRSAWSKREGRAKECGFDNFADMYIWINNQKKKGISGKVVSESIGKERHFAYRTIRDMNISLAEEQILKFEGTETQTKLRNMIYSKCSEVRACEVLGIELAAGRKLLGEFNIEDRSFTSSLKRGLTKHEMEKRIVQIIFDCETVGNGFKEAATELNISLESTRRYFIRYVRENMDRPK